jgi:DNA (cytosine-5)-methyltransferase 1
VAADRSSSSPPDGLTVTALFAGIGGIERGLHAAGHSTVLLCEIDDGAKRVLDARFPGIPLVDDVRALDALPECTMVSAGFPCQDLSQAGRTAGIKGRQSRLVEEVLRLVRDAPGVRWLCLENVPFMLQLERGRAMRFLTTSLEALGFSWAYRVVDARAFGLPQRRQRVILLASRTEDPREILLTEDAGEPGPVADWTDLACGFYWTEGLKGLGWAVDAVPTLKGGSTIGIPSQPAIWMASGEIVVPHICDAERMQGFPADWTEPAVGGKLKHGHRWKLVGNAVSVPVAHWLGERLLDPEPYDASSDAAVPERAPWPKAAWGTDGQVYRAEVSAWPVRKPYRHLAEFLEHPTQPLSARATSGFLSRAQTGHLRFPDGFLEAVEAHLDRVKTEPLAA